MPWTMGHVGQLVTWPIVCHGHVTPNPQFLVFLAVLSTNDECDADIDECQRDKGGCAQRCVNSPGNYTCHCFPGYDKNDDGKTCSGNIHSRWSILICLHIHADRALTGAVIAFCGHADAIYILNRKIITHILAHFYIPRLSVRYVFIFVVSELWLMLTSKHCRLSCSI